ncbi:NAD(P)H-flavin reductase (EC (EC [Bathymodiolus thermophilus thioautotrophic gill symbiont]|uniref:CDP-6-deoxy-delta-3,4-glucoseen reductase n=1 Tax=Bathymodiolus thermophilus thioautotrophic gill symbiont TaxID=2360 RepID=UPI00192AA486|nr:CDP-6-deoxy-delta-3,4-glucoseen reductase [Bathymodiolus thermophilus thioautotrophic gill symbiont]CAB5501978.1 NAD(P)H-flavin reductase (EC (EC [Bathymodiolus thermophilus thioautotrophic gill symbiont]
MFTIENQITGKIFRTDGDSAILEDALIHGLNFPYGCQKGFCGKCKATIIEGEVGYKGDVPNGITPEEVADGMALLCQCYAKSDVALAVNELDSVADIEVRTLPCKVQSIERLNHDVVQIFLKIPHAESLQYLAGQYIDLIHPDFEPRAFSIASAPSNNGLIELHVRLVEGGKFTHFIFNQLQEKSLLQLEGPKGDFFFREDSKKPVILMAGGTGFAPIKSIVEHAISTQLNRTLYIYWGVRDEVDLYMDLPMQWANENDNIHFVPVLSQPNKDWQGRAGFVHKSILADFEDLTGYEVYACGSPDMVKSAAKSFVEQGMIKDNFFSDAFVFAFTGKK